MRLTNGDMGLLANTLEGTQRTLRQALDGCGIADIQPHEVAALHELVFRCELCEFWLTSDYEISPGICEGCEATVEGERILWSDDEEED